LGGASNVPVQQVVFANNSNSPATITSVTLGNTGAGSTGFITNVTVSSNGAPIASGNFAGTNATVLLAGGAGAIPPSSSVTYIFTGNFSAPASGSYQFQLSNAAGSNGQPLGFQTLPIAGSSVVVSQPTATSTPSATFTSTMTPLPNSTPKVFPNPSSGGPIQVMPQVFQGTANIKVQLFTTAFRMVAEQNYPPQAYGAPVTIVPEDNWGHPLASGLYYAVVTVDDTRSIIKLLILR
jgi:hypothetical protein